MRAIPSLRPTPSLAAILVLASGVIAVSAVFGGCKKKSFDPEAIKLETFERPYFTVKMPSEWKVVMTSSDESIGRHKVEHEKTREFAEIAWQGGAPMTAAELKQLGEGVMKGFKLDVASSREASGEGYDLYESIARIDVKGNSVWLQLTQIQCQKTNVTISLGVGARERSAVEILGKRLADSFACKGDAPSTTVPSSSPITTFGDEWGQTGDINAQIVAHAGGKKLIFVFRGGGDMTDAIKKHPQKIADTYAALLGESLTADGAKMRIQGLTGSNIETVQGTIAGQPLVLGAMYCATEKTTYLFFATDETGADPALLLRSLGCPGEGKSITELKSTCELGLTELCDEPETP